MSTALLGSLRALEVLYPASEEGSRTCRRESRSRQRRRSN